MSAWSNWSGNVTATPSARLEIADEAALAAAIHGAARPIRVMGSGHSFSPLLEVEGGTHLTLTGLTKVEPEPGPELAARVGTGIRLRDLTPRLHAMGQALANMGDIDAQRVGGALATGTHGTGPRFGTYSSMIREMVLLDGRGQRHVLTRANDETAFRAMAVSLGTGGILTEAVLATVPPYRLAKRRFMVTLDEVLESFAQVMGAERNVEFYYITHSRRCIGMSSRETDGPLMDRGPDKDQQGLSQLRLTRKLLAPFPRLRRKILDIAIRGHLDENFTEDWHRAFPTDRNRLRFNECEYHVPAEVAPQAIREVIDTIEAGFPEVYFPMEIRTVKADDLFLSPFYGRESVSIAVHHEAGLPFHRLLAAVEPIFARFDGRPHWGKQHSLSARHLRPLYPKWDEAMAVRRELDPEGRFLSPYLRQLLGIG